jgi:hypothetical protein
VTDYDWHDMGGYRVRQLRIVIPFVRGGLAPETKAWGEEHRAEFVDLTGDDEGYFKLLTRLWNAGQEFYLVEQDIVPDPQQFTDMVACPQEWCAGIHKLHADAPETWSLGLMKFSAALLKRHFSPLYTGNEEPDGAELLAQVIGSDRHWYKVDLALFTVIGQATTRRGPDINAHLVGVEALDALRPDGTLEPHLHGPAARHLHHEMERGRGVRLAT